MIHGRTKLTKSMFNFFKKKMKQMAKTVMHYFGGNEKSSKKAISKISCKSFFVSFLF